MKNSISAAIIILIISIFSINATVYCSKPEDNLKNKDNNSSELNAQSNSIKKEAKKYKEPEEVKNVWKEMPSFDKYGNEITARMRENMQKNGMLNNQKNSENKK
ncbi:MAG TPA: hypothetical protein PK605_02850 [Ignavibacteria bacterium]|nr:hypothetical protein [Bacteroidota bacterium]HRE11334.1 hypothetical protein [Ignavibacteria bacterium]HRF65646.1 hypothetical protein [Ignavibacteria bacterium]HRJ03322.1 hypothetical protein [Ignavibacteria bacterium]HRJ84552.1 hypothetical protein [Ignavibacteria bacterium]